MFLLQIFIKPVMIATPFRANLGRDGWTEALRYHSTRLALAARRLVDLPRDIYTASSLSALATQSLQNSPFTVISKPIQNNSTGATYFLNAPPTIKMFYP